MSFTAAIYKPSHHQESFKNLWTLPKIIGLSSPKTTWPSQAAALDFIHLTFPDPSEDVRFGFDNKTDCSVGYVRMWLVKEEPWRKKHSDMMSCCVWFLSLFNEPFPAPSNRSPLVAFGDLTVAGGDLLEGPGWYFANDDNVFYSYLTGINGMPQGAAKACMTTVVNKQVAARRSKAKGKEKGHT